ncbi:hypothetical protein C1701_15305 [Actinoalloteichus sp. AHMU CJ021]|nr:hypothetical protein C1701_15305 [Actinoalloteichus sp. AHMU CJ021]
MRGGRWGVGKRRLRSCPPGVLRVGVATGAKPTDHRRRESHVAVVVTAIIDNVWHYARTEGERTALVRAVVDEPHPAGPSLLYVWDRPAAQGAGHEAWPEWQLRVSTVPDQGVGALNWAGDSPDGDLGPWDTYNPGADLGGSALLFDESAPLFFPLSATLALQDVRRAVTEHLRTGRRPECVQWQPGDWY